MKVITIRESVQDYLSKNFNINSQFIRRPFMNMEVGNSKGLGYKISFYSKN